jgi:hypothetical protein
MSTSPADPAHFWPDGARLVMSVSMQFEAGRSLNAAVAG